MKYILHDEGRIVVNDASATYEYHLKDLPIPIGMGNTRVAFQEGGSKPIQSTAYYPFGLTMNMSEGSTNKYLYNGKEKQELTDWLDYGARMYDASLGRWMTPDPLADFFPGINPYNYGLNDPINNIDIYGLGPWSWLKRLFGFGNSGNSYPCPKLKPKNFKKPRQKKKRTKKTKNKKSRPASSRSSVSSDLPNTDLFTSLVPTYHKRVPEVDIPIESGTGRNRSLFLGTRGEEFSGSVFEAGTTNFLENTGFKKFVNDIAKYLKANPNKQVEIVIGTGADANKKTVKNPNLTYGEVTIDRGFEVYDALIRKGVSDSQLQYNPQKNIFNDKKGKKRIIINLVD